MARRAPCGFSLVEILLVLAILAVLTGVAAPRLDAHLERLSRRALLDRFASDLYHARLLAARSGERVQLRFESAAGCVRSYRVEQVNPERVLRVVEVRAEAPRLCLTVSGGARLTVNSRGMPTGASRTLRVRGRAGADSLRISIIGRVHRLY